MDNPAQPTTATPQQASTNNPSTPSVSSSPKKSPIIFILLGLAVLCVLGITGWFLSAFINKPQSPQVVSQITQLTPTTNPTPTQVIGPNRFDLEQAKIGAMISGLKVKSVGPYKENIDTKPNSKIVFEGKVTLTGRYVQSGPSEVVPITEVCFEKLEPTSELLLPKLSDDTRTTWFCFSNPESALQMLKAGRPSNERTIEIENYTINYYPSEVYNTADLVSVASSQ